MFYNFKEIDAGMQQPILKQVLTFICIYCTSWIQTWNIVLLDLRCITTHCAEAESKIAQDHKMFAVKFRLTTEMDGALCNEINV